MKDRDRGFTLLELIIVLAIIGITAAVALPKIMNYLRFYKVRMAADGVRNEILAGRLKAVTLNVDYGVVFLVVSPSQYRYVIEDMSPASPSRTALTTLLADNAQVGPLRTLPYGVVFNASCTAGLTTFTANDTGLRFDRLGLWCDPGSSTTVCPTLGAGTALVTNSPTGSVLCVRDTRTGVQRLVSVSTGGRVVAQ